jgi:23S rRNA pseudouridine1911/1915/1917 synthase
MTAGISNVDNARFVLTADLAGARFDAALAQLMPAFSRSRIAQWIKAGAATVDGRAAKPSEKVWEGAVLQVQIILQAETEDAPQARELEIVFEDAHILVLNKPVGLVVHPGAGNRDGTLLNALLHAAPEVRQVPRAGIVHRLDKDTSGLMVVAKTLEAQTDLVRQLQSRTVSREYAALVHGLVALPQSIDADIGRHPTQRTKMAIVTNGGKEARTHVTPIQTFAAHTLVRCKLETGRTHQIRVHMAHIGHPLVGDPLYGKRKSQPSFPRQALHAQALGLIHPATLQPMRWSTALPKDFAQLLQSLA